MAHLKDALYELVNDSNYKDKKEDLLRLHASVIRVMKHLDQRTFQTGTFLFLDPLGI
jgi:hypothetical protein